MEELLEKTEGEELEMKLSEENFSKWLDGILEQALPSQVAAINFNLYEDGAADWSVELVGTCRFDAEEEDWACDEVFNTREYPLAWKQKASWEEVLENAADVIKAYLEHGAYAEQLKSFQGIGVGFVDGDIEILYQKKRS